MTHVSRIAQAQTELLLLFITTYRHLITVIAPRTAPEHRSGYFLEALGTVGREFRRLELADRYWAAIHRRASAIAGLIDAGDIRDDRTLVAWSATAPAPVRTRTVPTIAITQ